MVKHALARVPRRHLIIGAAALLVMGYFVWSSVGHPRMVAMWQSASAQSDPIPAHENAIVGGLRQNREASIQHAQDIERLQAQHEQARVTIERLQTELQQAQTQLALRKPQPASGLSEVQTRQLIAEQMRYILAANQVQAPVPPPPPKTQTLTGPQKPSSGTPAPIAEPEPVRNWIRIPDRSSAEAVTISGSVAQANGQSRPLNIVIEADVEGPNGVRIPLSGCRVAATLTVEAVPARAITQISGLSCALTLPDGRIRPVEIAASGWLTGADNMNGGFAEIFHNEAEIYKRFGQAAIPVALVSLLKETRQVVRQVSSIGGVVTTIGNDVGQEIAKEIAEFYIDKAREYFDPVAWVGDNQRVYVHFDGGMTLPIEAHELEVPNIATRPNFSRYRR